MIFPLNLITNEAEYGEALGQIENLFEAKPDTPDGVLLDALVTLVEAYERRHYPAQPTDAVEAVLSLLQSRGLNETNLEPFLGDRAQVQEFLGRSRALTLPQLQRLHREWNISAEALLLPYALSQNAA